MQLLAVIFFCIFTSLPASAGEGVETKKYIPLFEIDFLYEPGTITETYMKAYRSPTEDIAIQQWEVFLSEHTQDEPVTIEDMTDLALIRQAHYELMRLYYLAGRNSDADSLLKKANDLVVYSVPEAEEASRWCRRHGHVK